MALNELRIVVVDGGKQTSNQSLNQGNNQQKQNTNSDNKGSKLYKMLNWSNQVKEKISLPTSSKVSTVFFDVPISMQVIPGKIPNYYGGIIDSNSSMSFYSYK